MTLGLRVKIVIFASGLVVLIGVSLFVRTYYYERVTIQELRLEQVSNVLKRTVALVETPLYRLDVRRLRDITDPEVHAGPRGRYRLRGRPKRLPITPGDDDRGRPYGEAPRQFAANPAASTRYEHDLARDRKEGIHHRGRKW